MTNFEKAKEIRQQLLDMIAEARKNHRDFDAEQQKQFDEQKNELIALSEELKATEDKLDDLESKIPDVSEKAETPAEEQPETTPETAPEESAPEEKSDEDGEKPAEGSEEPQDAPEDGEQTDTKPGNEKAPSEPENNPDDEKINKDEDTPSDSDEDVKKSEDEDEKKKENKSKFYYNKMEKKNFSLVGAIRAASEGRQFDDFTAAVIDEGREQLRKSGFSSNAQIILPTETRTINVTDNHDAIIETQFTDILDILNASPVMQKARSLTGLVGDVQIPQILAGTAQEGNVGASWLGENTEDTLSHFKFDHRKLSPKRLSTTLILSKSLIMQDSIGVENAVRKALADAVRQKLEITFLGSEAGTTTKPVGIFYQKTATNVTDFKKLCEFEAVAERANYNAPLEYLLSPEAKAEIRSWTYGGGRTQRMVMEGQEIDGTPFISTSNVAAKKFAYINWNDILVGTWQGLELELVNDLSLARTNSIALVLSGFFDWMVLRPQAIQYATVEAAANNPG